MPYKVRKTKSGVTATNKRTGKKRHFKNQKAYKRWKRIAEAFKYGWRPK